MSKIGDVAAVGVGTAPGPGHFAASTSRSGSPCPNTRGHHAGSEGDEAPRHDTSAAAFLAAVPKSVSALGWTLAHDQAANRFPSDFFWGAATSALQVEGSPAAGGGESVWDVYLRAAHQAKPMIIVMPAGHVSSLSTTTGHS